MKETNRPEISETEYVALMAKLESLYEKHAGNIEAIFAELGESAEKALRYPPSNSKDFAERYVLGFYLRSEVAAE